MFAETVSRAVADAHPSKLDNLSRLLWQGHCSGALSDEAAQALAEAIQRRREAERCQTDAKPQSAPKAFLRPPPPQRSPDRQRSIERRRHLAASGPMPPALAARFTVSELAVLRIVADEVRARGVCDRSLAELAARAGCCRKVAQNVMRLAAREGLVTIERRPRPGRKHLTNIVRVVSAEWRSWLAKGGGLVPTVGQGEKKYPPRTTGLLSSERSRALSRGNYLFAQEFKGPLTLARDRHVRADITTDNPPGTGGGGDSPPLSKATP